MRTYVYSGLLAALLNPLAWWMLYGADFVAILGSNGAMLALFIIGGGINAVVALFITRPLSLYVAPVLRNMVVRFGGAVLAGTLFVFELQYLFSAVLGFSSEEMSGIFLRVMGPSFIATYAAYWLVSFLVKPVAPLPSRGNSRR